MPITKQKQVNPLNNSKQPLKLDSLLSKKRDRREYSKQRYQAKKQEYREWYLKRKAQAQQQEKEQLNKYSTVEAYRVLMPFKEYTELNQQKKQLWLDFNWTLKDCQEIIKEGRGDVVPIMKLEQVTRKLISDYWTTAKNETKKGKNWNNLGEEQQARLIEYWGQEKARKDNQLDQALKKQVEQGKSFEKDIKKLVDISTFHEERGKIKCKCWHCEEVKQQQTKKKVELEQLFKEEESKEKVECPNCGRKVKELDEENDACKNVWRSMNKDDFLLLL